MTQSKKLIFEITTISFEIKNHGLLIYCLDITSHENRNPSLEITLYSHKKTLTHTTNRKNSKSYSNGKPS